MIANFVPPELPLVVTLGPWLLAALLVGWVIQFVAEKRRRLRRGDPFWSEAQRGAVAPERWDREFGAPPSEGDDGGEGQR